MLTGSRDNKCEFRLSEQTMYMIPTSPPNKRFNTLTVCAWSTDMNYTWSKAQSQIPLVMYAFSYDLHFDIGLPMCVKTPNFKLI